MAQQRSSKTRGSGRKKRTQPQVQRTKVRFERTKDFRTIHVDGAYGGVTPNGGIAISFYHQHQELPSSVTIEITDIGTSEEVDRVGGDVILRAVEIEARMTATVARSLATWLIERAEELERATEQIQDASQSPGGTS